MAYTKKDWEDGEVITEAAMDNIENGVSANDTKNTQQDGKISEIEGKLVNAVAGSKDGLMSKEDKTKLDGIAAQANKYTLPAANKTTLGGVKQMSLIADLSTETTADLKNKINAILAEMKKQGIMANS